MPFIWKQEHQQAYETLKTLITSPPLLAWFRDNALIILVVDASKKAIGGCLLQPDENKVLHPVAYHSATLNPTQQKYAPIQLELLAIVSTIQRFHCYLYGRKFYVYSDSRPNSYLQNRGNSKHEDNRLQLWIILLAQYNFKIIYRPGAFNILADHLSRDQYSTNLVDEESLDND